MSNLAAWIPELGGQLEVKAGPKANLGPDEVLIQVAYVAVNPSEWKIQSIPAINDFLQLPYPHVLGSDVAGVIVRIGSEVQHLKIGQRVIGHCLGLSTKKATDGAYQNFATCKEIVVAPIPKDMSLAEAVVLPLAISTSSTALFGMLGLNFPSPKPAPSDQFVLIWSGSSSCGSAAIQLAHNAGYKVITTCSPHNKNFVKELGANQVFDYHSNTVVNDIVSSISKSNGSLVGAVDFAGDEISQLACAAVMKDSSNATEESIGLPTVLMPSDKLPKPVQGQLIIATDPALNPDYKSLGERIWGNFVPSALESGILKPKPEVLLIKGGLQKVQEGMEVQKRGVSAKKVVVEIDGNVGLV